MKRQSNPLMLAVGSQQPSMAPINWTFAAGRSELSSRSVLSAPSPTWQPSTGQANGKAPGGVPGGRDQRMSQYNAAALCG